MHGEFANCRGQDLNPALVYFRASLSATLWEVTCLCRLCKLYCLGVEGQRSGLTEFQQYPCSSAQVPRKLSCQPAKESLQG